MRTVTITEVLNVRAWDGPHGTVHYPTFRIDGFDKPVGVAPGYRDRDSIPQAGQTLDLEGDPVDNDRYPAHLQARRVVAIPQAGGGAGRLSRDPEEREEIMRQSARRDAVDLTRLYLETGKWAAGDFDLDRVLKLADRLVAWAKASS